MTRATWPLSRDAVEAAAREMLAYFSDPDDVPHDEDLNAAARALRAAIAAWVPSEGQVAPVWYQLEPDAYNYDCIRDGLLAALRAEAAE